jgi:hypothetical protein
MMDVLKSLREKPGIKVSALAPGTSVLLETLSGVYTLRIHQQGSNLVEVTGTDPSLRVTCVGQFIYSMHGSERIHDWIGKSLRPCIRFKNHVFHLQPAVSARVEGQGWHYDVF